LPQPYLGNPNKCSAITLNLNPGKPNKRRESSDGELVNELRLNSSYRKYAHCFPQLKFDSKFWKRQINWINRISDDNLESLPFAIEICHWHSEEWKDLDYNNQGVKKHLEENIFTIIDEAIKNSTVKTVLSVGKTYYNIFDSLGFKKLEDINREVSIKKGYLYPKNRKGETLNRNFSIWKSPNGTHYLNTYVQGSNMPPAKVWDEIVNKLLEIGK